ITALYPGMTVLLARWVLGERMRWRQRAGLLLAAAGVVLLTALSPLISAVAGVLEDQAADLEVELLRVRQVLDPFERLVLPRGLQDELSVAEDPPRRGPLERHVRHLGQRHHLHLTGDQPGRENEPLRGD